MVTDTLLNNISAFYFSYLNFTSERNPFLLKIIIELGNLNKEELWPSCGRLLNISENQLLIVVEPVIL